MQKNQCQWSVGSKDRVETDQQIDVGDCITFHANVVSKISSSTHEEPRFTS